MKKKKVVLLGGLILVLILSVYMIAWAAALDVGNDLNFKGTVGTDGHEIMYLKNPSHDLSAATWGYVKAAVNGNPNLLFGTHIGIWRQDGTSNDVYLNADGTLGLSGNVGIGTNDPQYLLDLQGTGIKTLQLKSTSTTGVRGAAIKLGDNGNTGEFWTIGSTGDGTAKALSFSPCLISSCSQNPTIYMTRDNKIGIGTSSPEYPLDIRSDGYQIIRASSTNTTGARGGGIMFGDANDNESWTISNLGGDSKRNLRIVPCVNDTCAVDHPILTFDGNLGLGGSDPGGYKLNVASAGGENPVMIGDDLTVGGDITVDNLNVDNNTSISGGLSVDGSIDTNGTMKVAGTGAEACNSSNVGMMRYYESVNMAYFQVCMHSSSGSNYTWYTIKSYSLIVT